MKDWDVKINYGIKTGFNEAFIISQEKKDELIKKCPEAVDIIRPILRGRDIKKYKSNYPEVYLICTFPSLKIDISNYRSIEEHLLSYSKERLEQTGKEHFINGEKIKSRKLTGNKWFETQDQIGYWKEFLKPKIIWKRIGSALRFCYDETGIVCLDSTCFASGSDMKFLVGYLNSSISKMQLLNNSPKTGTGDVITSVQALEPLLVPFATNKQKNLIELLVDKCNISLTENIDSDIKGYETQIDNIVFDMYNLNVEERKFVISQVEAI